MAVIRKIIISESTRTDYTDEVVEILDLIYQKPAVTTDNG